MKTTNLATFLFLSFISIGSAYAGGPVAPGTVLHSIINPEPNTFATFGAAIEVIGDRFAVSAFGTNTGSYYEGAVYLFDGSNPSTSPLLHTFHRPQPTDADRFGHALTSSGNLLAVADPRTYIGSAYAAGAVHVFDTVSGQLVRTITNPTPSQFDWFGWDVAAAGSTLLISELSEQALDPKAYLYDINTGASIGTITKPASASTFGASIATTSGQVHIGGRVGQQNALFSFDLSSGQLLHTFLDPLADSTNYLDFTLAAVGNKLVVGGISNEAYVLEASTGALLQTITDPGVSQGGFSSSLAPYESDKLLISSKFGPQAHLVDLDTGEFVQSFNIPQASNFPASIGAYASLAEINGDILVGNPAWRSSGPPADEGRAFRIEAVPEPSTATMLLTVAVALSIRRPGRARYCGGTSPPASSTA